MLHNFNAAGRQLRLWQNLGETYEHVLMKALGYAMFVEEYPHLEVEVRVGLRYKPDLIARRPDGSFDFWGECGINSMRKTVWILKHAGTQRLVLFKIAQNGEQLVPQLRDAVPQKYRASGRLVVVVFPSDIRHLTATKQIAKVSTDWYETLLV